MARTAKKKAKSDFNDRMKQLEAVSKTFGDWRPAHEVLTPVRSVPTIFPQINVGTKVGGWPLERIALIHGPSNHGKTLLCHGLGMSFLQAGHFYQLIDAEFTTSKTWLNTLMPGALNHPGFVALRPKTYEQTVESVTKSVEAISKAKAVGKLDQDVSSLIVVDSIRKLIPKRILEAIANAKDDSVDGMKGRTAMYKAALNSAWMDQLVPQMYHNGTSMIIIAREAENTDDPGMYAPKYKITGGKGIFFDSSIVARVTRANWVKKKSSKGEAVVGERHCVDIHKTKVGGKSEKTIRTYFHSSNGVLISEGFDKARDIVEMAKECGVFDRKGAYLVHKSTGETWQGDHAAVVALSDQPKTLENIEEEVMNHFSPEELEEDAEESDD